MGSERAQGTDYVFDFILLEQANAGNTSRSSVQARCGVFDGDAAESEDGDLRPARFSQGGQPGGLRPGNARFPEHRSENGEVGFLGRSAKNIGGSVARSGHEKVVSGQWQVGRNFQCRAHFMRRHIFCAKMNPVGSRSQSDIRTMVN